MVNIFLPKIKDKYSFKKKLYDRVVGVSDDFRKKCALYNLHYYLDFGEKVDISKYVDVNSNRMDRM